MIFKLVGYNNKYIFEKQTDKDKGPLKKDELRRYRH